MHDLRWIRENPEEFDKGLGRRGLGPQSAAVLELDGKRRHLQTELQSLQARRNQASKDVGHAKARGEDAEALIAEVGEIKQKMADVEASEETIAGELDDLLSGLPNHLAGDVPDGVDEADNREERKVGEIPSFEFKAKEHYELGEAIAQMDFELAARLAGSRFVVLRQDLARLHRALAQFMLNLHVDEHGYQEINPPVLVRDEVLFGTGQLPKFADQQFKTTDDRWLIPTAEVPLTNFAADAILDETELPLRLTAHTPCFRSEAGAAGRDTRGMLRQHQFEKVELVSIVHPDKAWDEHERMTACAEEVLKRLELPYRVMTLSSGDTGFGARKTYDIEVWLPGQGTYREISSCSNCGDFQARRMKGRFRPSNEKGTRFVHTLNGSGVAVGRALIGVMENYQQADGSIVVPDVLKPHMGGLEVIPGNG